MTSTATESSLSTPITAGGRDILAGTIAEMTWFEVERAAKAGAILLWAFGVVEQHGPHLPAGTDIYIPSARLRALKVELAERGIEALIVPPYYWGVNVVSGSFPASYRVRPELMREIMADVFGSFETDGFRRAFCFSGHGDALHNRSIVEGITLGRERTKMDISFVLEEPLAMRLGLTRDDPRLALHPSVEAFAPFRFLQIGDTPAQGAERAPRYLDIHAGESETSMMMGAYPGLVNEGLLGTLVSTDYGPDDLAEWRHGFERARRKTPLGYFGDPASSDAEEGRRLMAASVARAADAIEARLRTSAP